MLLAGGETEVQDHVDFVLVCVVKARCKCAHFIVRNPDGIRVEDDVDGSFVCGGGW